MTLSPSTLTALCVGAAVVSVLALGLALLARRGPVRRGRGGDRSERPASGGDPDRLDRLETGLAELRGDLAQSLRHIAVVRYDAFGDMGGRMSFSAAVVDDRGDGMVLSSIHARGESRTYAKGVVGGRSDVTLTPEEQQALAAAREEE